MSTLAFATDLHGSASRYESLFQWLTSNRVDALLLGGDLLPGGFGLSSPETFGTDAFVLSYLETRFLELRQTLGDASPRVFLIMGNDDPKYEETAFLQGMKSGAWTYCHGKSVTFGEHTVCGYSFIPPSPFHLKDWERYDVSRFVDTACVSPAEGYVTVPMSDYERNYQTIADDLTDLFAGQDHGKSIFLFHAPPYKTPLDRAALDGKMVDYVPLDVHIGSIAVERFIRRMQPLVSFHGHVHEAVSITGEFMTMLESTPCYQGAHDGPELALTLVDTLAPKNGTRILI
ncbi:metallophosphoesterase [Myxococcota bacterium]|nr:metallophosphoesterase [Myxococcota bacterium]MBU1535041.1 metallophosphoesterase [Myxococcota bacterium]